MAVVSQTIGPITAYAIAKAEGYTGTKEQFATEIANAAANAQTASTAATNAHDDAVSAASSASQAMSTTPTGYNTLMESLVNEYSTESTYAVGDYCRESGVVYRCTTAVTTAGAFDSTKWTAVTLANEVNALSTDLSNLPDYRFPFQKNSTLKDASNNDISDLLYSAFKDVRIYGTTKSSHLCFGRVTVQTSQILITVWNTSYTVVAQYYKAVTALPTGVETITLPQSDGSGISLKMVVNWDAFTTNTNIEPLIYSRCGFADECYHNEHDLEITDIISSISNVEADIDIMQESASNIGIYQPSATLLDKDNNDISTFLLTAITDIQLNGATEGEKYSFGTFVRAADHHFQITIWNSAYTLVCQSYVADASSYTGLKTLPLTTLNNSGITGQITINFDVVTEGTSYSQLIYAKAGIADKFAFGTLREQYLEEIAETGGGVGTHRWKSKNWYAIGDSFTEQNIYPYYLNQYCGFSSYYNAGQSGRGMSAMVDKLSVEPLTNYDIVTVFAGTNDYGAGTSLGTMADTAAAASFYGYTKNVIETILTAKPSIRLAFITPTQRGAFEDQPVYPAANSAGVTLDQYADAIIEVCKAYAIPVLDMFRNSQFNSLTLTTFTSDNLHPNTTGGQVLARQIQGFIEAL